MRTRAGDTTRRVRAALVAVVCAVSALGSIVAAGPRAASAASCSATGTNVHTWTGTGDGSHWGDPANWSPFGVPGTNFGVTNPPDIVCIQHSTDTVVVDNGGPDGSGSYRVKAVLALGTVVVQHGGELFVEGSPSTDPSSITNLTLRSATLGGTGKVTVTGTLTWHADSIDGAATMTTRPLAALPPKSGGLTTAPSRLGTTVIAAGAQALIDDVGNTACVDGGGSGVQLRDGRRLINSGTLTIAKCAYVAADWGTRFDNYSKVSLLGGLGYFEGFLGRDLVWPVAPPLFVNNASGTIGRKTNVGLFKIAARYSGTGSVTVASGTDLAILDSAPAAVTHANAVTARAAGAAVGVTDCSNVPVGTACTTQYVQTNLFRNSTAPLAPAATVALVQDPTNIGSTYAATNRKIVGADVSFAAVGGAPTSTYPYVITITGPAHGNPASAYSIGFGNKVAPFCSTTITTPCLAGRSIDAAGNVRMTVKATVGSGTITPLGPRIYR